MFVAIYVVDIDVYILSVVVALSVCVVCGSETGHPILRLDGNVLLIFEFLNYRCGYRTYEVF